MPHLSVQLQHPRGELALGVVWVSGVTGAPAKPELAAALAAVVQRRQQELEPALEARRAASRRVLRYGTYKPTGRSKPASEYLLRSARQGEFPRVNGLVDANNLVSLKELLPISVWDLDLAQSDSFVFHPAERGASYVFNAGGQEMDLSDLLCGFSCGDADGQPIVNPVKDSLKTKTTEHTTQVVAAIYCPLTAELDVTMLTDITRQLERWLCTCGAAAQSTSGVVRVGTTLDLTLP